jgi:RNA polymerase sigma factor (sigma-70 family)
VGELLDVDLWREPERRRLVGLCAAVSGDRAAAEDLAQETLLEAWRNRHKLHDPAGADRWLTAIARNVCRRWARTRGRDAGVIPVGDQVEVADELDVEVELERAELVDLLDRALALLPPATRDVLVHRYVHDSPHAEIAARLGVSEDAVAMRLSRGKLVLRAALASQLRDEATAYGLVVAEDGWRETRVWCSSCGDRKLQLRRDDAIVAFRCPGCGPNSHATEVSLENRFFVDLVGDLIRPSAILARTSAWSRRYFALRAPSCTGCGRGVQIRRYVRDDVPPGQVSRHGLFAECDACGVCVSCSAGGLALAAPDAWRFRRRHTRTRFLPLQEVERSGTRAFVVRIEDALGSAGVDVLLEHESLRLLGASETAEAAA